MNRLLECLCGEWMLLNPVTKRNYYRLIAQNNVRFKLVPLCIRWSGFFINVYGTISFDNNRSFRSQLFMLFLCFKSVCIWLFKIWRNEKKYHIEMNMRSGARANHTHITANKRSITNLTAIQFFNLSAHTTFQRLCDYRLS